MKPPFMMLKSPSHSLLQSRTISERSPLVPGKLADESQLGQLTSLFAGTQQTKQFHAPKPPKKRYLEENYSQNKFSNSVIDNGLNVGCINKNSDLPSINIPESKKIKTDENLMFPDVNPLLPDVVPRSDCSDLDPRTSWRKKLLCWEKLDETEQEFNLISETDKVERRVGRKPKRLNEIHHSKDSAADEPKPGRRGRARACKGQKYREFMWTNVIHQRRKSSRWELCQDTVESSANNEDLLVSNKTDTFASNSKADLMPRSSNTIEVNSINNYYRKKKVVKRKVEESPSKKAEVSKTKGRGNETPKKRHLKRDPSFNRTSESSSNLFSVTGSKKRKLRRQSIRRLEPGSKFKDTRVVEDAGIDTLASLAIGKMKLRSGSDT